MNNDFSAKNILLILILFTNLRQLSSQTVQEQLNNGIHPCTITSNGAPIDSLIGKTYGGGFIFYFDSVNCDGLIAAPASQDTVAEWGCFLTDLDSVPNVPSAATPSGLGAELFDGRANTFGIIYDCATTNIAAKLASGFMGGGFSDWHLPSILELVEMHQNIGQGASNNAEFSDDLYWASTESSSGNSWILDFSPPTTSFALGGKHLNLRVRAIRKINPPAIVPSNIIYVDSSATGSNNGLNWADAFTSIEAGLVVAEACDSIFVAAATYYPDTTGLLNYRTATFSIPNSISLFGGFPTGGGVRDIGTHATILSGAIDPDTFNYCYHVVSIENVSNKTRLDGFTITNGIANGGGAYQSNAGGLIHRADIPNQPSSPTIANCIFLNNEGTSRGGAISNLANGDSTVCSPTIINCLFQSNQVLGSNGEGGGICNDAIGGVCNITLDSCQFIENYVIKSGGGIHNHASNFGEINFSMNRLLFKENIALNSDGGAFSIVHINGQTTGLITNCQFIDNTATQGGGAITAASSNAEEFVNLDFTDCLFDGNKVLSGDGGGIRMTGNTTSLFHNCNFLNNTAAQSGGGFIHFAFDSIIRSLVEFDSCLFENNEATLGDGGAIDSWAVEGEASTVIKHTIIKNNRCGNNGGGLMNYANLEDSRCFSYISTCVFEGNSAFYGGGVSNYAFAGIVKPTFIQCLFFNDTATVSGAMDIFGDDVTGVASPQIINCTFTKNTTFGKSAVLVEAADGEASPLFLNSIIWGNNDTLGHIGFKSIMATPMMNYTLVDADSCGDLGATVNCGDSMIYNIDPNFVSIDSCDFHFNGGSIAVNAGQNDSLIATGTLLDLDGEIRIKSGTVDLGVYELDPCPNIISLLNERQTAGIFHAVMKVESNGFLKATNQAIYQAGTEIDLLPEFEVQLGAEFEASIAPCTP